MCRANASVLSLLRKHATTAPGKRRLETWLRRPLRDADTQLKGLAATLLELGYEAAGPGAWKHQPPALDIVAARFHPLLEYIQSNCLWLNRISHSHLQSHTVWPQSRTLLLLRR